MRSLKGHLLVATPQLLDPNFARTVLLMLEHTEEGAVGVVLNRPMGATVADIAEQVFEEPVAWDKPLHLGGPVPGPLMTLHTLADQADQEVLEGLYSSVEAGKVRQVLRQEADPCLVVANYAGWGPGQLERELSEGSWLILPATAEHVFWDDERDLWATLLRRARSAELAALLRLRGAPEDPSLN